MAHFREFRCDIWILNTGDQLKLDPKANKFIFVGFEDGPRAIRYYSSATRRIRISHNFTFETHTESDANYIEFGIGEPAESVEQSAKPVASEGENMKVDDGTQTPVKPPVVVTTVAPTPTRIPRPAPTPMTPAIRST